MELSLIKLAIFEATGGAVAGVIADTVLYAIDSAKVRSQSKPIIQIVDTTKVATSTSTTTHTTSATKTNTTKTTNTNSKTGGNISISLFMNQNYNKYKILFRGLAPTVLLGSVPVFATFFLLYAPLKHMILTYEPPPPSDKNSTTTTASSSSCDSDSSFQHGANFVQQQSPNPSHTSPPTEAAAASSQYFVPTTTTSSSSYRPELILPILSGICAIPATIVGVPADVLKKRLVLGIDPNVKVALRHIAAESPNSSLMRGLFAGWHVNLIRDIPFAGIKIGLYEYFVQEYIKYFSSPPPVMTTNTSSSTTTTTTTTKNQRQHHHISPSGAAICGVASGVCCAIITAPLDVINTHIKAGNTSGHHSSSSIIKVGTEIIIKDGIQALYRGVLMRSIVLGIGSFIFWPIQRSVTQSLETHHVTIIKLVEYY